MVEKDINIDMEGEESGYVMEKGKLKMEGKEKDIIKDERVKKEYLGLQRKNMVKIIEDIYKC